MKLLYCTLPFLLLLAAPVHAQKVSKGWKAHLAAKQKSAEERTTLISLDTIFAYGKPHGVVRTAGEPGETVIRVWDVLGNPILSVTSDPTDRLYDQYIFDAPMQGQARLRHDRSDQAELLAKRLVEADVLRPSGCNWLAVRKLGGAFPADENPLDNVMRGAPTVYVFNDTIFHKEKFVGFISKMEQNAAHATNITYKVRTRTGKTFLVVEPTGWGNREFHFFEPLQVDANVKSGVAKNARTIASLLIEWEILAGDTVSRQAVERFVTTYPKKGSAPQNTVRLDLNGDMINDVNLNLDNLNLGGRPVQAPQGANAPVLADRNRAFPLIIGPQEITQGGVLIGRWNEMQIATNGTLVKRLVVTYPDGRICGSAEYPAVNATHAQLVTGVNNVQHRVPVTVMREKDAVIEFLIKNLYL